MIADYTRIQLAFIETMKEALAYILPRDADSSILEPEVAHFSATLVRSFNDGPLEYLASLLSH